MAKTVFSQDATGNTRRISMDEHICNCMLDLIEEKPFHTVKAGEIAERAGISRSTFYNHFDSIYAVVQRIEDDFFESFWPVGPALKMMDEHDYLVALSQVRFSESHARTIRLLGGPNGDSYFNYKIESHYAMICREFCKKRNPKLKGSQLELRVAYVAGAVTALTRKSAMLDAHMEEAQVGDIAHAVWAANDAMLDGPRASDAGNGAGPGR